MSQRIIGLRAMDYKAASLHPYLKKEPPAARQPTPDEDILRPPDDSSDEDTPDSDFGDAPPPKKRKLSESGDSVTMESIPRQPKTSSVWDPLPPTASDIKPTVWTSSQRNSGGMDEDLEEVFSLSQKSERKKSKNTYSKNKPNNNIHTAESKPEKPKKTLASPAKTRQDAQGFMTRDTTDLESRLSNGPYNNRDEFKFKVPPDIAVASPERPNGLRRSTRSSDAFIDDTQPSRLPSGHATPTKSSRKQPTFRAPKVIEVASPQRGTRSLTSFRQPLALFETDEVGTDDMQGLLKNLKSKQYLPSKLPASSTTDSSLLSISNGAASSSSLTSPADSPGLDCSNDEPAPALCPVCKIPVDRAFLEEFNNGKPLRARQQTYFCKAHKIRIAEQEWKEKGYPKIDWANFDRRLEKLHPLIEDILAEKKPSYYRNAFEDRISRGQMKTLKATLFDSVTMEGVLPGYYGSRGARAIIEDITSRFAARIRGLSSSDSVISTGGVPSYIQAVLAPEVAVRLVMEDMKVPDEEGARCIIRDSVKIGNLLNEEQDEAIHVIESEDELAM